MKPHTRHLAYALLIGIVLLMLATVLANAME
jgi:hypothetical protein